MFFELASAGAREWLTAAAALPFFKALGLPRCVGCRVVELLAGQAGQTMRHVPKVGHVDHPIDHVGAVAGTQGGDPNRRRDAVVADHIARLGRVVPDESEAGAGAVFVAVAVVRQPVPFAAHVHRDGAVRVRDDFAVGASVDRVRGIGQGRAGAEGPHQTNDRKGDEHPPPSTLHRHYPLAAIHSRPSLS